MYTHSPLTLTVATAMIEKVSNEIDSYSGLGCFAIRVKVSVRSGSYSMQPILHF